MATLAIPASLAGAGIAQVVGGYYLQRIFGLFLLFVSYRFMKPLPKSSLDPDRIIPIPELAVVGGISGLFSSILGVGGGIFTVSLLNLVLRVPIHRAVANSSGLIVFTTIAGTLGWIYAGWGEEGLPAFSYGYINMIAWALISFTAVLFAQLGAWAASRSKPEGLRKPFAGILVLVGIKMLFF
jgi:uncharacterized membrane protein YfcA